jgi:hypothetical protein
MATLRTCAPWPVRQPAQILSMFRPSAAIVVLAVAMAMLAGCGGDDGPPGTADPIANLTVGDCLAVIDVLPDDPNLGESISPSSCSSDQAVYTVVAIVDSASSCPIDSDVSLTRSEVALDGPLAGGARPTDTVCVEALSP